MSESLVIWQYLDSRPGHQNQVRGLVEAISRLCLVSAIDVCVPGRMLGWFGLPRLREGEPRPHLLIGAGHRTHIPMLRARRRWGGRVLVLMRPSLPTALFDLCLIPDSHTDMSSPGIVMTRGALNRLRPSNDLDPSRGLVLVGGPSKHHNWDHSAIVQQVSAIPDGCPHTLWEITTSRRTPAETTRALSSLARENVIVTPFEDTNRDWLPERLRACSTTWVTEDSVSMVYEAMTAGSRTGVLRVPRKRSTRLTQSVDRLLADEWVTSFDDWTQTGILHAPPEQLDESTRCAQLVLERFVESDSARIGMLHSAQQKVCS